MEDITNKQSRLSKSSSHDSKANKYRKFRSVSLRAGLIATINYSP